MPSTNYVQANPGAQTQNSLFDKIINLVLIAKDGTSDEITCPTIGLKPDITLKGQFSPGNQVLNIEVRLKNFYASRPLDQYSGIQIEAGYSGSIQQCFQGTVQVAFQESPSPDGVVVFQVLIGNFTELVNQWYVGYFPPFTSINSILRTLVSKYKTTVNLISAIPESSQAMAGFYCSGLVSADIQKLASAFSFNARFDGQNLICVPFKGNTGIVHNIENFSSPPKKDASGITFTAPWIPNIRSQDVVKIQPQYFRQSFGGTQVKLNSQLVVNTVDFSFATNDSTNSMTVVCIDTGGAS